MVLWLNSTAWLEINTSAALFATAACPCRQLEQQEQLLNCFYCCQGCCECDYHKITTCTAAYPCRQLEQQQQLGWSKPDFNFYVNYLHRKIALYDELAGR
jgi:hypothetical protein